MDATVDIVIVNWNSGDMLRACVDSVIDQIPGVYVNVIVVDNNSVDNSFRWLGSDLGIQLLCQDINVGFARACNEGARMGDAEFLLFLNPDAVVHPGTLQFAVTFMRDERNMGVGICGVQLVDEAGHVSRNCSRFPSAAGFVADAVGINWLFPSFDYGMSEWPHDSSREVDHVIGAFYLVRRVVFDALGGFDERFFVYLEDLDFSYRAHKSGWRSVYLADVRAAHIGGGASRQVKARRMFYSIRSRILYAFKNFSTSGATLVLLATLIIEPLSRSVLAVIRGSRLALIETWQGYAMLWRWLPQWIFKGVTR